jgi:hypothetical protein
VRRWEREREREEKKKRRECLFVLLLFFLFFDLLRCDVRREGKRRERELKMLLVCLSLFVFEIVKLYCCIVGWVGLGWVGLVCDDIELTVTSGNAVGVYIY